MNWQKHRGDEWWLIDSSGRIVGVVEEVDLIGKDVHYGAAVYPGNQVHQQHIGRYVSERKAKEAVEDYWKTPKGKPTKEQNHE